VETIMKNNEASTRLLGVAFTLPAPALYHSRHTIEFHMYCGSGTFLAGGLMPV
jgi:hypothetical protein